MLQSSCTNPAMCVLSTSDKSSDCVGLPLAERDGEQQVVVVDAAIASVIECGEVLTSSIRPCWNTPRLSDELTFCSSPPSLMLWAPRSQFAFSAIWMRVCSVA
jgi:hypothetical protein